MREPTAPRTVQCYHCRQIFDVPPRAMSISCPWCYKRVGLDDMAIKGVCWTSKLQTCGRIIVRPKAQLVAPLVEASQGIEVYGEAEGILVSGAQIYIGPRARVKGQLRAPSIKVERGGAIDGAFVQIAASRIGSADPGTSPPFGQPTKAAPDPTFRPVIRIPEWIRGFKPA
jgi:hypothetical protein